MADKIQFDLVSPAKLLASVAVDMVVVPGAEGDFGAMAQHSPLISTVRPGVIEVHDGGKVIDRVFVAGGFSEVTAERVTVLAEAAYALTDITDAIVAKHQDEAKAAEASASTELERANAQRLAQVAAALEAARK